MNRDLAKDLALSAFRAMRELSDWLPTLKEHCDDSEYQGYLKAIGTASASISTEIIHKVFAAYPDIEQELEAKVARYGRLS